MKMGKNCWEVLLATFEIIPFSSLILLICNRSCAKRFVGLCLISQGNVLFVSFCFDSSCVMEGGVGSRVSRLWYASSVGTCANQLILFSLVGLAQYLNQLQIYCKAESKEEADFNRSFLFLSVNGPLLFTRLMEVRLQAKLSWGREPHLARSSNPNAAVPSEEPHSLHS